MSGTLRDLAFRKENVDQSLGLVRIQAIQKQLGLSLAAFLERQAGSRFDGVDGSEGSDQVALFLADSFARGGKYRRVVLRVPSF